MQTMQSLLKDYKQNNKLPIRLVSPSFGHLPSEIVDSFRPTHRTPYYFLLFMVEGFSRHGVDLQQFEVKDNELLFILPHQIHQLPSTKQGTDYFKLGFDENCLALLPKQYPFLINPLNQQKLKPTTASAIRLKSIFGMLLELLREIDTNPDLILAHLNSLLTEINEVYFSTQEKPADNRLSKYIQFKLFVESHATNHPTVIDIAQELGLNTNSLYSLVKNYSGLSPKEFVTSRIILEAKRRLYYSDSSSIKELAYDLGFNDPEYFARLFKKETGKTIAMFIQDLSGN